MYKTSTAFNQAIKNGERIYVKVKCGNFIFGYNDETDPTSPNEQNNIMELNIDRSISHDDYALAKSYACGCNCVLWAVPAGAVLRGQKTVVYFGCMVNGAVEWVPMGVFYPEKVTRSGECTTLEMYDHMYDLSMPYSAAISGQQTPLAILKDLARQGNFELAAGVESKVSGFGTVDVSLLCGTETDDDGKQQVTAYNVNDAIGYVAGFCGCAAVFDREGKLRVDTFAQVYDGTAEYAVTDDTVTEVSLAETDKTYLGISCNNGNKNILAPDSLSVNSEVLYFDNPLITTQAQAEKVFGAVSDMIYIDDGDQGETVFDLGIQYRPGSMTLLTANPALDSFDVITYRDDTGDHHIPLMGVEYDYDGSVTMDVAAHARSEQEGSSAGSILSRMISKAMQQVTAPLAQRIQDATDSITNAVGGYAALIDRDGDGVSDALYIGEYPAAEGKTKGRCLLLNKNGMAVSTTGLQGPFKDFAVYYNKKTNQYYLNATDISAGRLSGIEILADKGTIAGWNIDENALYCDAKSGTTTYRAMLNKYGNIIATNAAFAIRVTDSSDNSTKWPIVLRYNGQLIASNVDITGKIVASSGSIGIWNINDSGCLYKEVGQFRTILAPAGSYGDNSFRIQLKEKNAWGDRVLIKNNGDALFRMIDVSSIDVGGAMYLSGTKKIVFGSGSDGEKSRIDYAISSVNGSSGTRLNIRSHNSGLLVDSGTAVTHFRNDHANFYSPVYFKDTAYTSSGSTVTSDERLKQSISSISDDERYTRFFSLLRPVSFKYANGTSGRTHMGLVAQSVKMALKKAGFETQEIAAYVQYKQDETDSIKTDDGTVCALRYEEFTALNVAMIQKQQCEIEALKREMAELKALLK